MRRIPTSGGLEIGPPSKEGPWIDIIPQLPFSRPPIDPEEISQIVKGGISWLRWNRETVREALRESSLPVFLSPSTPTMKMVGVVGSSEEHRALIRFLWRRDQSPFTALREIEGFEGHLSPALAGAVLAAAQAREYPVTYAPSAVAMACDLLPSQAPTYYDRQEIADLAEGFLDILTKRTGTDVLIPGGAADRARFWLQVARRLWNPKIRRRIAEASIDRDNRLIVAALAAAWAEVKPIKRVEVAGRKVRVHTTGAWPHLVEWEQGPPIPREVLDSLVKRGLPSGALSLPYVYVADAFADYGEILPLTEALLEEAEKEAAYTPIGDFILTLQREYPLCRYGLTALHLWVDPEGMWVEGLDPEERSVFVLRWRPGRLLSSSSWVVAGKAAALLDATLAALWRDLRVAGEEAVPPRRPRTAKRGRETDRPRSSIPSTTPVTLPRKRRPHTLSPLSLSGRRVWGTHSDRDYIREIRPVAGHIRRLPPRQKPSDEAKRRARLVGIVLPKNCTYVRPHSRQTRVRTGPSPSRKLSPRPVKARGLATVMALLAEEQ